MTNIKLLQKYKNNNVDDVINVSDTEATELIKSGVARLMFGRDCLIKPKHFGQEVNTRAFEFSPSNK